MRTNLLFLFLLFFTAFACGNMMGGDPIDYRHEMRMFVQEIAEYGRGQDEDFIVIPQNGHPLLLTNGSPETDYLNAIDGLGQESLLYGYPEIDLPSPASETERLMGLLNVGKAAGKTILVTDYCFTSFKVSNSYSLNQAMGYLSFAAPKRELTEIPSYPRPLPGANDHTIQNLGEAKNFLYLLNKMNFDTKTEFIEAIQNTNYDVIIIDAFYGSEMFLPEEVEALRVKANGGKRLVISYLSIGEAEVYRYYWDPDWISDRPDWLVAENPYWEGNYKVRYWDPDWKSIIYGQEGSYLQRILNAGFDGVYLDIIDAYAYFE